MYLRYTQRHGSKQTYCVVVSDWLTVKRMEGTMRDVVEVFCTVILRNYDRGLKKTTKGLRLVWAPADVQPGVSKIRDSSDTSSYINFSVILKVKNVDIYICMKINI